MTLLPARIRQIAGGVAGNMEVAMQHSNNVPDAPKPGAEYLNEHKLADYLGISVRTLQGWRLQGDHVPYYKIGRLVRYSASEVKAWLAGRQCRHTSDAAIKGLCSIRQVYGYTPDIAVNAADPSTETRKIGSAE